MHGVATRAEQIGEGGIVTSAERSLAPTSARTLSRLTVIAEVMLKGHQEDIATVREIAD